MKTDDEINMARMHVKGLLNSVHLGMPGLGPAEQHALSGMYAALCWAMDLPGLPSRQFAAIIGEGHKGEVITSPNGIDMKTLLPTKDN